MAVSQRPNYLEGRSLHGGPGLLVLAYPHMTLLDLLEQHPRRFAPFYCFSGAN